MEKKRKKRGKRKEIKRERGKKEGERHQPASDCIFIRGDVFTATHNVRTYGWYALYAKAGREVGTEEDRKVTASHPEDARGPAVVRAE